MNTKNIPSPAFRNVRINRDERSTPFLSNIVPGTAEQTQPNGCTYSEVTPEEETGIQGSNPWIGPVPPSRWPSGNRSGE